VGLRAGLRNLYSYRSVRRIADSSGGYLEEGEQSSGWIWGVITPQVQRSEGQVRQYPYRGVFDASVVKLKVGDRVEFQGQTLVVVEVASAPESTQVVWLSDEYLE
jgi:hypothetical protein